MTRTHEASTRVEWHKHDAGRQVVLSVDGQGVRIAVALATDAPDSAFDAALTELERELDRYHRGTSKTTG